MPTGQTSHTVSLASRALLSLAVVLSIANAASAGVVVEPTGDCSSIQEAVNNLPPTGGEVTIRAGVYICRQSVVIDRDNVVLRGEGEGLTVLRVADDCDCPALLLGQTVPVPNTYRRNIHISNLTIDGNREKQPDECQRGPCTPENPLRNNGITFRRVDGGTIDHVTVSGARSGGVVAELGSMRLNVSSLTSTGNRFDGFACYETKDSEFTRLYLNDNGAAGVSFDIRCDNNVIHDAVLVGNQKVGVFIRDSRDDVFYGFQIRDSGEHGIFLAQVDADETKPALGNIFSSMVIANSKEFGIRVNDSSCINNLLVGVQFVGNANGCISEPATSPGLLQRSGTICR